MEIGVIAHGLIDDIHVTIHMLPLLWIQRCLQLIYDGALWQTKVRIQVAQSLFQNVSTWWCFL